MSFRPEVVADSTGKWIPNSLRFATQKEAEDYVIDLAFRWTAVGETRVVECTAPVNAAYRDDRVVHLEVD